MKSPQVANVTLPADREHYSDLKVLSSNAGYYIGTTFFDPVYKFEDRGTRDSGYFATHDEAAKELAYWEANGPRNNRLTP